MSYIIHSDRPFIFIHIPKTAGNAVWKTAKAKYNVEVVKNTRTQTNYHSTLRDVEDHYISDLHNPFIFSFVRNPWERVCSWYFFRLGILKNAFYGVNKTGKFDATKVENNPNKIGKELNLMQTSFDSWLDRYKDQPWDYTWFKLSDTQSSWLTAHNISTDKIIKTDNIDQELSSIKIFGNTKLPKTNKSKKTVTSYRQLFSSKSRNLVGQMFEEDIDNFKFTF